MLDWIDQNKSDKPDQGNQSIHMVIKWGRKNYIEDAKKLQMS
jgi:hypothetical protein